MENIPRTRDVLSSNLPLQAQTNYFLSDRPHQYLERKERALWAELGPNAYRKDTRFLNMKVAAGQVQLNAFEKTPSRPMVFKRDIEGHRETVNKWLFDSPESVIDTKMKMLERAVDRARLNWACISAKTQREENFNFKDGRCYTVKTYSQLTEVAHKWERPGQSPAPPSRKGDPIKKFSKRSRQRMMSKARKLNQDYIKPWNKQKGGRERVEKSLPVPWFVTLTYHKNFQDCETAKEKHLNNFLERWRKRGKDFAYFWKMEPQERGAVHFHLALFLPEGWQEMDINYIDFPLNLKPENEKKFSAERKKLIKIIATDWAEVTKDVDGYTSRYSRITRKNKGGRLSAACLDERTGRFIDWEHLKYGTNVRECENWKMFLGYCYKYLTEDVKKYPFTAPEIRRCDTFQRAEITYPPAPFSYNPDIEPANTGRFWGFSYNLDFEALQTGIVDHEDLEEMNRFCNTLNTLTFTSLTNHLIQNAKRAKKQYSGKTLQRKLDRYRRTFESQKRRYRINQDKIKEGYFMQFEIKAEKALAIRKYLREENDFNKLFQRWVAKFENTF